MSVKITGHDGGEFDATENLLRKVRSFPDGSAVGDAYVVDNKGATLPRGASITTHHGTVTDGDALNTQRLLRPPWNVPWGFLFGYYYGTPAAALPGAVFGGATPSTGSGGGDQPLLIHNGAARDGVSPEDYGGISASDKQHWVPANRLVQLTATIGKLDTAEGTPTGVRVKFRRHVDAENSAFPPVWTGSVNAGSVLAEPGYGVTFTSIDVLATSAWVKYSLSASTSTGKVAFNGPVHFTAVDIGPVTDEVISYMFGQPGALT
jgi:hypothetical protein